MKWREEKEADLRRKKSKWREGRKRGGEKHKRKGREGEEGNTESQEGFFFFFAERIQGRKGDWNSKARFAIKSSF